MLSFFHAPKGFTLKPNVRFPEIRFRGSAGVKAEKGFIPFSHIYMTSASQLSHFRRFADEGNKLVSMTPGGTESILGHDRCPVNLTFAEEGIEDLFEQEGLFDQRTISVAVINGMGRGYGDNVAGLGVLQQLRSFLESRFEQVAIHILQRNAGIQSVIYQRYDAVDEAAQLPVSVTRFFSYDAYADFSDLLSIKQFDQLPLYEAFLQGMSLQRVITDAADKRTRIHLSAERISAVRNELSMRAGNLDAKYVLLHPTASTPLRSMPPELVGRIVDRVTAETDVWLVTCSAIVINHPRLIDMQSYSTDINAFFDIIGSCNAVITVGTVTYHVSGNLDIPTLLIPTVRADVDSSNYLPVVECYLPESSRSHISDKHMSREDNDITQAGMVWANVDVDDVVRFVESAI